MCDKSITHQILRYVQLFFSGQNGENRVRKFYNFCENFEIVWGNVREILEELKKI